MRSQLTLNNVKIKQIDSSDRNVTKFVYEFDKAIAESVLYRYNNYETRTVICCSTQSGCPIGCRFCGAGDYFVRNLTADEILAQVRHSVNATGIPAHQIRRLQIMFMSMGEPLLNMQNLIDACKILYKEMPNAALLISTSAPRVDYAPLFELSKEVPTIGLQFSLHEIDESRRDTLIPFKNKLSIDEIVGIGERRASKMNDGRRPFFNYCAGPDNTNNGEEYLIADKFNPKIWNATISVICERDESIAAANQRQRVLATIFENKLKKIGFNTRTFDPAGQDDIGGGCGQLWFVQEWMRTNPNLAHKSIGNGKPSIHTPK